MYIQENWLDGAGGGRRRRWTNTRHIFYKAREQNVVVEGDMLYRDGGTKPSQSQCKG